MGVFCSQKEAGTRAEDFAEGVVAYRYNGAKLKSLDKWVYEYMKIQIFNGVEYDSAQSCSESATRIQPAESGDAKQSLSRILSGSIANNPKFIDDLTHACIPDVLEGLQDGTHFPSIDFCVRQNLHSVALSIAKNARVPLPSSIKISGWQPNPEFIAEVARSVQKRIASIFLYLVLTAKLSVLCLVKVL